MSLQLWSSPAAMELAYVIALCLPAFLATLAWLYVTYASPRRPLPPRPPCLPVIGHLHLFRAPPHKSLHRLAQKYGPIMFLRLGSAPTVVISSPALAKEFLHRHDEEFANRPRMEIADRVLYGNQASSLMEHNQRWRDIRKLYVQEILSAKCTRDYKGLRDEEIASFLRATEKLSGKALQIRDLTIRWATTVITRSLFSESATEGRLPGFMEVFRELSELFVKPIIGDLIPYLKWFDPGGYRKSIDAAAKSLDAILDKIVSKRVQDIQDGAAMPTDMLTSLLDFNKKLNASDTSAVKAMLFELLAGGTETTSSSVEWAMAEILRAPEKMKKLQEELDVAVAGDERQVEESDFPKLPYLHAVMKETWRLHPPVPLLVPHFAKQATEVAGYKLPANTRLMVNAWAIGRDADHWEKPSEFMPERFLAPDGEAKDVVLSSKSYELLPFGSGRRSCPGIHLGIAMASLAVANLVHSFEWEQSSSCPLSMEETLGVTASLAQPLIAIPTPRRSLAH